MTRGTLASILALLLLTACTGDGRPGSVTAPPGSVTASPGAVPDRDVEVVTVTGDAEASTSAAVADPSSAVLAWRAEVEPLSGPVLVDGVLVLYTRDGEGLALTAVEPTSGEVVWSRPATPSRALTGVGLRVEAVGDDRVVHLEPLDEGPEGQADARVVVRAAATGEVLVRVDETASHYRMPRACEVPGAAICLYLRAGDVLRPVQGLTADGVAVRVEQSSEAMRYQDPVGPLGLRRMTGQDIGRVQDGKLVWAARTDEIFGPGASTNTGWIFRAVEGDSLLVGSVGPVDDPREGQEVDLRDYAVAALDAATGERRWVSEATSLFCDIELAVEDELEDDPLLACRYAGGVLQVDGGGADYADVEVSLVRLDPRTGDTLWERPLPSPPDEGRPDVSPLDEKRVIVAGLIVDLEDGAARPSTGSETAWREDDSAVELSVPRLGSVEVYPDSRWLLPLGTSLDDGPGPRWPLPPGVGVEVDGARVVTVDGQLVRWKAP